MKKQTERSPLLIAQKCQLHIAIVVLVAFLVACNSTSSNKVNHTSPVSADSSHILYIKDPSVDSAVLFLLESSAMDFRIHQHPSPIGFRNVHVRNLMSEDAKNNYMICGEFQTKGKQGSEKWTSFATIKTSGYEQWIGNQSLGFCKDAKEVNYKTKDLSYELKSRLDSLNNLQL